MLRKTLINTNIKKGLPPLEVLFLCFYSFIYFLQQAKKGQNTCGVSSPRPMLSAHHRLAAYIEFIQAVKFILIESKDHIIAVALTRTHERITL